MISAIFNTRASKESAVLHCRSLLTLLACAIGLSACTQVRLEDIPTNFKAIEHKGKFKKYRSVSKVLGPNVAPLVELGEERVLNQWDGKISIKISGFTDGLIEENSFATAPGLLPRLGSELETAFAKAGLKVEPTQLELVMLPDGQHYFHRGQFRGPSPPWILKFYVPETREGFDSFELEWREAADLAHEAFHLVVNANHVEFSSLSAEETYASLFGLCVGYQLTDIIPQTGTLFAEDAFAGNPTTEYEFLAASLTEQGALVGSRALVLASYQLQYLAKSFDGRNVTSPKIEKFCGRVFADLSLPIDQVLPPVFTDSVKSVN